jgi:hypothetical protein
MKARIPGGAIEAFEDVEEILAAFEPEAEPAGWWKALRKFSFHAYPQDVRARRREDHADQRAGGEAGVGGEPAEEVDETGHVDPDGEKRLIVRPDAEGTIASSGDAARGTGAPASAARAKPMPPSDRALRLGALPEPLDHLLLPLEIEHRDAREDQEDALQEGQEEAGHADDDQAGTPDVAQDLLPGRFEPVHRPYPP